MSAAFEKKHAPATQRNRAAIAGVLARELPASGTVLEIASGTGEHAVYLAEKFPDLDWQPSDIKHEALKSILAYHAEYAGTNLRLPMVLDAAKPKSWEIRGVDAILCINMVHISPWWATDGLFAGCADCLGNPHNPSAPLILYGPYFEDGVEPAQSNIEFDRSLRERNEEWGIRYVSEIDALAEREGLRRTARIEVPANNLMLVYRC